MSLSSPPAVVSPSFETEFRTSRASADRVLARVCVRPSVVCSSTLILPDVIRPSAETSAPMVPHGGAQGDEGQVAHRCGGAAATGMRLVTRPAGRPHGYARHLLVELAVQVRVQRDGRHDTDHGRHHGHQRDGRDDEPGA